MAAPEALPQRFHIRLATMKDLEQVVDLGERAFIRDPLWNYFGNLKEFLSLDKECKERTSIRNFTTFIFKSTMYIGGRVTVMLDKESKDSRGDEKIVTIALWHPPKRRLAPWMVVTLIRGGFVSVLSNWGLTGLMRIVGEYSEKVHAALESGFKGKGMKASDLDKVAWYLQLTMTDPDYQGKGLMSRLLREGFANAPNSTFALDATTAHSRDRYTHLGFEVVEAIRFGEGKVDVDGLQASGVKAAGVDIWAMIKVGHSEVSPSKIGLDQVKPC